VDPTDSLITTVAQTLVPGDPRGVMELVESLVEHLWPHSTETVLAEPPRLLMHSVSSWPDGIDAWLTWELTAFGSTGWTIVRLIHDEADTSPGPPPELDILLRLVAESATSRAAAEG
jgi:hypothetical protein